MEAVTVNLQFPLHTVTTDDRLALREALPSDCDTVRRSKRVGGRDTSFGGSSSTSFLSSGTFRLLRREYADWKLQRPSIELRAQDAAPLIPSRCGTTMSRTTQPLPFVALSGPSGRDGCACTLCGCLIFFGGRDSTHDSKSCPSFDEILLGHWRSCARSVAASPSINNMDEEIMIKSSCAKGTKHATTSQQEEDVSSGGEDASLLHRHQRKMQKRRRSSLPPVLRSLISTATTIIPQPSPRESSCSGGGVGLMTALHYDRYQSGAHDNHGQASRAELDAATRASLIFRSSLMLPMSSRAWLRREAGD